MPATAQQDSSDKPRKRSDSRQRQAQVAVRLNPPSSTPSRPSPHAKANHSPARCAKASCVTPQRPGNHADGCMVPALSVARSSPAYRSSSAHTRLRW